MTNVIGKRLVLTGVVMAAVVFSLLTGVGESVEAATVTVVVTFDDPAGVYAPGDVVESGVHVWTPDAFKFTVADWDTSDSDKEIKQRGQGKIIVIELSSGANFDFVSIYGQGGWGYVRFTGYNSDGDAIVSFSFQHTTCASCTGSTIFLPSVFENVAKVTLQTPLNGGGVIDIHHWDDITLEFDDSGNGNGGKAGILIKSGVSGKGLATAPGLEKEFNPTSKAAEKVGKKN